jgi:hypothetical protein
MARRVLDRLQSLLVALSLAFLVWMYVNGKERWDRRIHEESAPERGSPASIECFPEGGNAGEPGRKP